MIQYYKEIFSRIKQIENPSQDIKDCIEIIEYISSEHYKCWSKMLDYKEKLELTIKNLNK